MKTKILLILLLINVFTLSDVRAADSVFIAGQVETPTGGDETLSLIPAQTETNSVSEQQYSTLESPRRTPAPVEPNADGFKETEQALKEEEQDREEEAAENAEKTEAAVAEEQAAATQEEAAAAQEEAAAAEEEAAAAEEPPAAPPNTVAADVATAALESFQEASSLTSLLVDTPVVANCTTTTFTGYEETTITAPCDDPNGGVATV